MKKFVEFVYENVILLFALPIMAFLLFLSICSTSYVTYSEDVYFLKDSSAVNVIMAVIFGIFAVLLSRSKIYRKLENKFESDKKCVLAVRIALLVIMFVISVLWVVLTQYLPFGDSDFIHTTAIELRAGIYEAFKNNNFCYIDMLPYQTRTLMVFYLMDSLMGGYNLLVYQILNCVALVVIYDVLGEMSVYMGGRQIYRVFVIAAGILWFPGILYTSFIYGNLYGLALSLLAIKWWVEYLNGKKGFVFSLLAALCMVISYCFKSLFAISFIGVLIYAITVVIGKKEYRKIAGILITVAGIVFANIFCLKIASHMSGEPIDQGHSMYSWIEMGLSEKQGAPGWYSDDSKRDYASVGNNHDAHEVLAKEKLGIAIDKLKNDGEYAKSFFIRKYASQWNEPSFQSMWILRSSDKVIPEKIVNFASYSGYVRAVSYLDLCHLLVCLGGVLYLIFGRNNYSNRESLIFPLIIIGQFLFHTVWEAKAQYAFMGFILMIPMAVCGYFSVGDRIFAGESAEGNSQTEKSKAQKISLICIAGITMVLVIALIMSHSAFYLSTDNISFAEYMQDNFY